MKNFLSHVITFLLGLMGTAIYHHWSVNPNQVAYLQQICDNSELGYLGDWVLDIFFPILPLVVILGIWWAILHFKARH